MTRYVAVDGHRLSFYVVIQDAEGRELLRRKLPGGAAGVQALLALLQPGDQVVLEATTGAWKLANRLESKAVVVHLADPQRVALMGFRGKKTDYRDCLALLQYLRSGTLVSVWRPDPRTRQLRQLLRERYAYNQSIVRLKNRLKALLRDEALDAPDALFTQEGAAWLATVALPAAVRRVVEREWAALQMLEELKESQEAELASLAAAEPQAWRLLQLAGFGAASSMLFLGEVGDLRRFPSGKQLVSYAGLDPRVSQSGERQRGGRISKAGRSQLRWLLQQIAWAHVRAGGPEAALFHRLVQRGKPVGVAITALARRLLVLAYLLLTREEAYREVEPERYEAKLARVATHRPVSEQPEPSNVDWAAEQVEAVTGQVTPRRARAKERGVLLRRSRGQSAVTPEEAGAPRSKCLHRRRESGANSLRNAGDTNSRPEVEQQVCTASRSTIRSGGQNTS